MAGTSSAINTPTLLTSSTIMVSGIDTMVFMGSPAPTMGGSGNYIRGRLTISVRERTIGVVVREAVEVIP